VGAFACFVAAGVGALTRRRFIARRVVVPTDMESFDKAIGGPLSDEVAVRGLNGALPVDPEVAIAQGEMGQGFQRPR
jgi:hypothetical protein